MARYMTRNCQSNIEKYAKNYDRFGRHPIDSSILGSIRTPLLQVSCTSRNFSLVITGALIEAGEALQAEGELPNKTRQFDRAGSLQTSRALNSRVDSNFLFQPAGRQNHPADSEGVRQESNAFKALLKMTETIKIT